MLAETSSFSQAGQLANRKPELSPISPHDIEREADVEETIDKATWFIGSDEDWLEWHKSGKARDEYAEWQADRISTRITEQHVADDEGPGEVRKARVARTPDAPTAKDIREHLPNHADYRSWCKWCVFGKGCFQPPQAQRQRR